MNRPRRERRNPVHRLHLRGLLAPRARPPGRALRTPALNLKSDAGRDPLFDTWRFHAFFTTTDSDVLTPSEDKTHRAHAAIKNVHADLKNSALAHLPRGKFAAHAAWLVLAVTAFNLTRSASTLTGLQLAWATTTTVCRTLLNRPGPDRVLSLAATAAPLHELALATGMETSVRQRLRSTCTRHDLTTQPPAAHDTDNLHVEHPDIEVGRPPRPLPQTAYAVRHALHTTSVG